MSLTTELELIRNVPLLSAISPAEQKLLCFSSERLTFEAGAVLFREGDDADAAYLVIHGSVEISIDGAAGRRVLGTVGRNHLVGEIAIFGDVPRTATATATTQLEALRITKELFTSLVDNNAAAARQLNRILAKRLANTTALLGA
jgi:CRP-like cAMP-binding protein